MHHQRAYCADSAHHPKHHFKRKLRKMMEHKMTRGRHLRFPKVNVQELDNRYELFVYAAGYAKEDFKVDLIDDTLIIAANSKAEIESNYNWRRQEFRPSKFERQFELNDKIDKDTIEAKYEDGILKVTFAKKEGFETVRKEVKIN